MMEITHSFNELLKAHGAPSTRQAQSQPLSTDQLDSFLQTAPSINREITSLHDELSSIRQAYLSAATPHKSSRRSHQIEKQGYLTDTERNTIDREAKDMLRVLGARINVLTQQEIQRQEVAANAIRQRYARGLRALAGWAAGGGLATKAGETPARSPEHAAAIEAGLQIGEHRRGVLQFLSSRLQAAATLQRTMMETRLARDMEKNKGMWVRARGQQGLGMPPGLAREFGLNDSTNARVVGGSSIAVREDAAGKREQSGDLDLTNEQRQMFERDNRDMLKHFSHATEKMRTVENSLVEIAELQAMLVGNLTVQSANIEQLVVDSERTEENVGGGNKQLRKATGRKFSQARMTFYAASALCTFLIVWDLMT